MSPLPGPTVVDALVVDRPASRALAEWLGAAQRLPVGVTRVHVHHRVAPGVPTPPGLERLSRALTGRLAVGNPGAVARIPRPAAVAVHGLVRLLLHGAPDALAALRDPRAAAEVSRARAVLAACGVAEASLAVPAPWCVVTLVEAPAGQVTAYPAGDDALPVGHRLRLARAGSYRLLVAAGTDALPSAGAARAIAEALVTSIPPDAMAGAWPAPEAPAHWLAAELLLPEGQVLPAMTPDARAAYLRATGRAGAPETYWHLDAWERHAEPGRHVGHVSPAFLARRAAGAIGASTGALALSPRHDVGLLVPPGYCLVQLAATLRVEVSVPS